MALSANSNWKGLVGHADVDIKPVSAQNDDWDTDPVSKTN